VSPGIGSAGLAAGVNPGAVRRLDRAVGADRLHHSLLFYGPPGSGREATAHWLAARLLCEAAAPPCGECRHCGKIAREVHPDVVFLRPASKSRKILIDQVRTLHKETAFRPFEASGRLFGVMEADRMTDEAANAFLKTLEEPPPDLVIVLTAPSPESMLPTVRSRCQAIHFPLLPEKEAARTLAGSAKDLSEEDALVVLRLLGGDPVAAAEQAPDEVVEDRDALLDLLEGFAAGGADEDRLLSFVEARHSAPRRNDEGRALEPDRLRRTLTLLRGLGRDALRSASGIEGSPANADRAQRVEALAARLGPRGAARLLAAAEEARRALDQGANRRLAAEDLLLEVRDLLLSDPSIG